MSEKDPGNLMMLRDAHDHPLDDDACDAQTLAYLTAELAALETEGEPMVVAFHPVSAFQHAALLQLALRHPHLPASNRAAAVRFLDAVRAYFADSPTVLDIIARGDDPAQDVRR